MQISTGIKDFRGEMMFYNNHCKDMYGNEYEIVQSVSNEITSFELKYTHSNFKIKLFKKRINDMQICLKKESGIKRTRSGKPYWTSSKKKSGKESKKKS